MTFFYYDARYSNLCASAVVPVARSSFSHAVVILFYKLFWCIVFCVVIPVNEYFLIGIAFQLAMWTAYNVIHVPTYLCVCVCARASAFNPTFFFFLVFEFVRW